MKLATLGIDLTALDKTSLKLTLKDCAERIKGCQSRVLADCFTIGKELERARSMLRGEYKKGEQEGAWLKWLADDVNLSRSQADRFINVWHKYGRVSNVGHPSNLPFSILAELAAPDVPVKKATEIEQRAANGEKMTVRKVAAELKTAKKKPARKKMHPLVKACVQAEQDLNGFIANLPCADLPFIGTSFVALGERILAIASPKKRKQ